MTARSHSRDRSKFKKRLARRNRKPHAVQPTKAKKQRRRVYVDDYVDETAQAPVDVEFDLDEVA